MAYTFPTDDVVHADGTVAITFGNIVIDGGTFKGDTDTSSVMDGSAQGQAQPDNFGSTIVSGSGVVGTTAATTIANQEAENYIMKGVSGNLATVASTVLASAAALHGIARNPVHDRNAVRTQRVASAVRSGGWNIYDGTFDTAPTEVNDQTDFLNTNDSGADDETVVGSTYGIPGEHAYRDGGPNPVSGSYDAKTA